MKEIPKEDTSWTKTVIATPTPIPVSMATAVEAKVNPGGLRPGRGAGDQPALDGQHGLPTTSSTPMGRNFGWPGCPLPTSASLGLATQVGSGPRGTVREWTFHSAGRTCRSTSALASSPPTTLLRPTLLTAPCGEDSQSGAASFFRDATMVEAIDDHTVKIVTPFVAPWPSTPPPSSPGALAAAKS